VVGSGSGAAPTLARVGSVALQKGGVPLETHEQALAAAVSGGLLGASLLGARFPRLVAWPLTATGALIGSLGVVRAARSALSDAPRPAPRGIAQGRRLPKLTRGAFPPVRMRKFPVGLALHPRTTNTGQWAWRVTESETLPIKALLIPPRPLLPITIRPAPMSSARWTISRAGSPS
jgi:hypothetical protein